MNLDVFQTVSICGLQDIPSLDDPIGYSHCISLINPGFEAAELDALAAIPARLVLRFHDEIAPRAGYVLPQSSDVEALIAFGQNACLGQSEAGTRILIHCHSGISRSTAAAAILLAQALPEGLESLIMARILEKRPVAWPNSLMLGYADTVLGTDLAGAARQLFKKRIASEAGLFDRMVRLRRTPDLEQSAKAHESAEPGGRK